MPNELDRQMSELSKYKFAYRTDEPLQVSDSEIIHLALEKLRLTPSELARQVGCTQTQISSWKSGQRGISPKYLRKFCYLLGNRQLTLSPVLRIKRM